MFFCEETRHHRSGGVGAKCEVEGCGVPWLKLYYLGLRAPHLLHIYVSLPQGILPNSLGIMVIYAF